VGSGGEFCSREHRNQFRLRLGMDRLQEANKVANLMRRRENAKAIPASQLARDRKASPRAAAPLHLPVRAPAIQSLLPRTASLEITRISSTCPDLLSPRPPAVSMRAEARPLDPPAIDGSGTRPLLPQRGTGLAVKMPSAGMAALHRGLTRKN